jgi:hypothetical protein
MSYKKVPEFNDDLEVIKYFSLAISNPISHSAD